MACLAIDLRKSFNYYMVFKTNYVGIELNDYGLSLNGNLNKAWKISST